MCCQLTFSPTLSSCLRTLNPLLIDCQCCKQKAQIRVKTKNKVQVSSLDPMMESTHIPRNAKTILSLSSLYNVFIMYIIHYILTKDTVEKSQTIATSVKTSSSPGLPMVESIHHFVVIFIQWPAHNSLTKDTVHCSGENSKYWCSHPHPPACPLYLVVGWAWADVLPLADLTLP